MVAHAPIEVDGVVDTTGAGDAFAAGYLLESDPGPLRSAARRQRPAASRARVPCRERCASRPRSPTRSSAGLRSCASRRRSSPTASRRARDRGRSVVRGRRPRRRCRARDRRDPRRDAGRRPDRGRATAFRRGRAAARKVGARDLAACCVQGALGATTVGGTLAAVRPLGIEVMATGGLGGVHRGFPRAARHLVRPRRARAHPRGDRLLWRQVAARRAGHEPSCSRRSASRCSAIARTRCRCSTRPPAARRSPRASSRPARRPPWRVRTGGSARAARSRSRDRRSRAWTTSSR